MVDGAFESLGLQLQNAVSFVLIRWWVAGIWSSGAGSHRVAVLRNSAAQGGGVQPEFKIRKNNFISFESISLGMDFAPGPRFQLDLVVVLWMKRCVHSRVIYM